MILYSHLEPVAELEISKLSNRRQEIYQKLNNFHQALKEFERVDLPEIEKYIDCKDRYAALVLALKKWFEMEKISIAIDIDYVANSIEQPDPVKKLLIAWDGIQNISSDPMRYWTPAKQKFKILPVTKSEKEKIHSRNKIFVRDEETHEMVKHLWKTISLVNFSNDKLDANITLAKLHESAPWLTPLIGATRKENSKGFNRPIFGVREDLFYLRPDAGYTAFDE